jgi:hypothetical protein
VCVIEGCVLPELSAVKFGETGVDGGCVSGQLNRVWKFGGVDVLLSCAKDGDVLAGDGAFNGDAPVLS